MYKLWDMKFFPRKIQDGGNGTEIDWTQIIGFTLIASMIGIGVGVVLSVLIN